MKKYKCYKCGKLLISNDLKYRCCGLTYTQLELKLMGKNKELVDSFGVEETLRYIRHTKEKCIKIIQKVIKQQKDKSK